MLGNSATLHEAPWISRLPYWAPVEPVLTLGYQLKKPVY
jgi:hypothetical protein